MSIKIQITHKGQKLSLFKALELGHVQVVGDKIEPMDETEISLSSKLFDSCGNELFENDIVKTSGGKQYKIIYDTGMFYLSELTTKSITPLCIYKLGNRIDVEKVII